MNDALHEEIRRLRWLIEYALGINDVNVIRRILLDALHGVNGASDFEQVRATQAYQKDALRFGVDAGEYAAAQSGKDRTVEN